MNVNLLRKIRKAYDIVPNIDKRYGFYAISKRNGGIIDNQPYGSDYIVEVLLRILFGHVRSILIIRMHEQNQSERKSRTILKRIRKQQK